MIWKWPRAAASHQSAGRGVLDDLEPGLAAEDQRPSGRGARGRPGRPRAGPSSRPARSRPPSPPAGTRRATSRMPGALAPAVDPPVERVERVLAARRRAPWPPGAGDTPRPRRTGRGRAPVVVPVGVDDEHGDRPELGGRAGATGPSAARARSRRGRSRRAGPSSSATIRPSAVEVELAERPARRTRGGPAGGRPPRRAGPDSRGRPGRAGRRCGTVGSGSPGLRGSEDSGPRVGRSAGGAGRVNRRATRTSWPSTLTSKTGCFSRC